MAIRLNIQVGSEPTTQSNWAETSGFTNFYSVRVTDIIDEGLMPIPTATGVKVVRRCAKQARRVYLWRAQRYGVFPDLPAKETDDPNEVLLRSETWNETPILQADGKIFLYTVGGVYEYLLKEVPDKQPIAKVTHLRNFKQEVTKSDFKRRIVGGRR